MLSFQSTNYRYHAEFYSPLFSGTSTSKSKTLTKSEILKYKFDLRGKKYCRLKNTIPETLQNEFAGRYGQFSNQYIKQGKKCNMYLGYNQLEKRC